MNATPAPSGATHRHARESRVETTSHAAPGAPHRPTTAPGESPAPSYNEPLGGRTPATLASLEGNLDEGAGAASAGYVTRDEKGRSASPERPEEEISAVESYHRECAVSGATVVPFSEFTERHRLLYEAKRKGCEPYALAIAEVAELKNLVRAIVFMSGASLVESHLVEANRLAGTPLPWDRDQEPAS